MKANKFIVAAITVFCCAGYGFLALKAHDAAVASNSQKYATLNKEGAVKNTDKCYRVNLLLKERLGDSCEPKANCGQVIRICEDSLNNESCKKLINDFYDWSAKECRGENATLERILH